jgi:SynChlorMet cassette protein ScmD
MSTDSRPIANPVVVLREEFDDWAVVFNPDTAEAAGINPVEAAGINPVGVAAWKMMDGSRTVEEIIAAIREQFDDVPETAPEEIVSFVEQLAEKGFVGYEETGGEE